MNKLDEPSFCPFHQRFPASKKAMSRIALLWAPPECVWNLSRQDTPFSAHHIRWRSLSQPNLTVTDFKKTESAEIQREKMLSG
jgi:hypothetical protein